MDYFEKVIDFMNSIGIDNLISVIIGALLSALLSSHILKKREKEKTKLDLELETVKEVLYEMKSVGDKLVSVHQIRDYLLESFNNQLIKLEDGQNINLSIQSFFEYTQKDIRENFDEFQKSWFAFSETFISFILSFESKEIILSRFIGIKEALVEEEKKTRLLYNKIFDIYNSSILTKVTYSERIDEEEIELIKSMNNEVFIDKRTDITVILYDLKIELQNEYLSDLFDFSLPRRKPQNSEFFVYTSGYVHKDTDGE
jgi:glutamate synthase domain-containing protein 2